MYRPNIDELIDLFCDHCGEWLISLSDEDRRRIFIENHNNVIKIELIKLPIGIIPNLKHQGDLCQ